MADHQHGTMDTTEQEKTFNGFIAWVIRTIIISVAVLLFLAVFNS